MLVFDKGFDNAPLGWVGTRCNFHVISLIVKQIPPILHHFHNFAHFPEHYTAHLFHNLTQIAICLTYRREIVP